MDHGEYDKTPLMEAAEKGDVKRMIKLIEEGANVSASYGLGWPHAGSPVLRYAIDSGVVEGVRELVKAGANVNAYTENQLIYHNKDGKNLSVRNLPLLSSAIKSTMES